MSEDHNKDENLLEADGNEDLSKDNSPSGAIPNGETSANDNTDNNNSDMEVHYHPHHQPGGKPVKEYFLEYIMIFLAVTTGFFAESYRETLKEQNKEKEYIRSMINDVEADTAKLNYVIKGFKISLKFQDSILINLPLLEEGKYTQYFKYEFGIKGFPDFIYTDITMQQLRGSDGMRLIKNPKAVTAMLAYDANVKKAQLNVEDLSRALADIENYSFDFFNYRVLDAENRKGKTIQQIENDKTDILRSHDIKDLDIYYNKIRAYKWIFEIVEKQNMEGLKLNAEYLIKTLKTEYKM